MTSPLDRTVAGKVVLFALDSGRELQSLRGHADTVRSIHVSLAEPERKMRSPIIVLVCVCVAAALMHAQRSAHLARSINWEGCSGQQFFIGWPFVSTLVARDDAFRDGVSRGVDTNFLFANLFNCVVLLSVAIAGLVYLFSPRRPVWHHFTLSGMFTGVTAMGIIVFLLIWDGNSRPIGLEYFLWASVCC